MGKIHLKDAEGYQLPDYHHTPEKWRSIVYALAAMLSPLNKKYLRFIWEGAPGGFMRLPTEFDAISMFARMLCNNLFEGVEWATQAFAVGHKTILHRPGVLLWSDQPFTIKSRIQGVTDKGKSTLFTVIMDIYCKGELVVTCENTVMILGYGNFGGPNPKLERFDLKGLKNRTQPLFERRVELPENIAALYRLTGDENERHINPEHFEFVGPEDLGDERPKLPIGHGLLTKAIASTVLTEELCNDDPSLWESQDAAFTKPVHPTDILIVRGWKLTMSGSAWYEVWNKTTEQSVLNGGFSYRVPQAA